ncbi:DNA phosphorothioation-associated putative methyltransferase [Acidovorax delafieldii]|uniref:DNA phosphorothioation-associated putative methyltransferase n=1 Tax=Acidovorax delafieldii TaxID=47920 RepID=A0AAJ2F1D4_ACIDE|nr:DNA phosphorothioation-associated putative methyltransferase [Acidovorax delafieldii]MDR6766484.1 DNA phosphorothioation-associated putative methyltransferase [Acidovorax delafieldii]MDR6836578.1 DNA phosphorothioation-associated putative methyltransferase [Acidovorax delafieldii]MDR7366069.1 DNA phosphorothioation-associated putative methyltransferase [Acidovorax delafieldii]
MSSQIGKQVGDDLYLHRTAVDLHPDAELRELAHAAWDALPASEHQTPNVFKLSRRMGRVSWLAYPNFDEDPFPALATSWTFAADLSKRPSLRLYAEALNPPILHRKELLVPPTYPERDSWIRLTAEAESLGLFEDASTIGFRLNWLRKIQAKGYRLQGYSFIPIGNDETPEEAAASCIDPPSPVRRHLTALTRAGLSAPIQLLIRHGLLTPSTPIFDYGCGKGDDLASLQADGYTAAGWDPYYAPDLARFEAHVVNIGFVLNVIEDPAERVQALSSAFQLATGVLAVAIMLPGGQIGHPWGDGIMTSRGTFQKYFTQSELKDFLEEALHQEAFLVGPGVAFVFADKTLEQSFLAQRLRRRDVGWRLLMAEPRHSANPRSRISASQARAQARAHELEQLRTHLDAIWMRALDLGRWPEADEVLDLSEHVEACGSLTVALRHLQRGEELALLQKAAAQRADDLRLFMAVMQFDKRPPYRQLDLRMQRDVKAFFGDYRSAQAAGIRLLVSAADPAVLLAACQDAAQQGLGHLEDTHSLQLHVALVERLPVVLRAYVACGLILWGNLSDVHLVKIHIGSGKLTLLELDHFEDSPLPLLRRRIKVNVRNQHYDVFEYGTPQYPKPHLYRKSRYLHEEQDGYAEQHAFDLALESTGLLDESWPEPSADALQCELNRRRLTVEGFRLSPSNRIPDLDEPCGANFTFRDFIECGETQRHTQVKNVPLNPQTYNALHALAVNVLDPVIDYFGAIRLTYGFCGTQLGVHIQHRVAPKLDQHASHEVNRLGRLICPRGGAACDFIVDDEDMEEVARWMLANLPLDRMYFYGPQLPLHVSYGPELSRQAFRMGLSERGNLIPRPFT